MSGDFAHSNVRGKEGVESSLHRFERQGFGGNKPNDLPLRMDAAVGAAGGFANDRLLQQSLERFFQFPLDRGAGDCFLPAKIAGTVIGDDERVGVQG